MRTMALDVGDRRIGVAVTDELGWTAQGVGVVQRRELSADISEIARYVDEYNVATLVVGLPLRGVNSEVGIQAKKVLKFVDELKKHFAATRGDMAIETWDESMTTHEAHEVLAAGKMTSGKRKKVVDKIAAIFILESYMRGRDL